MTKTLRQKYDDAQRRIAILYYILSDDKGEMERRWWCQWARTDRESWRESVETARAFCPEAIKRMGHDDLGGTFDALTSSLEQAYGDERRALAAILDAVGEVEAAVRRCPRRPAGGSEEEFDRNLDEWIRETAQTALNALGIVDHPTL